MVVANDIDIATRAVDAGYVSRQELNGCLAERRSLLKQGEQITVRELLIDRGLLDQSRWEALARGLNETTDGNEPAPLPQVPSESRGSERLGDYRIVRELGRGAMGVVYEAVHEELNRRVGLKILPETHALRGVARERFLREARATAALKHPGIVPIYDIGEERGVHFFAMELIEGRSLRQLLDEQGPFAAEEAARIVKESADALEYAHEQGVIHRDVKPDNILLRRDGRVVLTDFGLARFDHERTLTQEGAIVGTPLYMSPEQARGDAVDRRADVYGLGITLYQLLADAVPFQDAEDTRQLLDKITADDPEPLASLVPDVPPPLAAIVEVALAKEPASRFPTAGAMSADLERYLRGEPIEARPPSALMRTWWRLKRNKRQLANWAVLLLIAVGIGLALRWVNRRWKADAYVLESISLIRAGKLAEADEQLERALRLSPRLAEALFRQGEIALLRGDTEAARSAFTRALAEDPDHVETHLVRGGLERREGRFKEALADFQAATKAAGASDPRPAINLGLVLVDLDRGADALTPLKSGLELARQARLTGDPSYVEAVLRLGELELRAGNYAEAQIELEEAVRLSPTQAMPRLLLTRALLAQGDLLAAAEAASEALRRDPESAETLALRGQAHRLLGRSQRAIEDLTRASKQLPRARLLRGLLRFEAFGIQLPRDPDEEPGPLEKPKGPQPEPAFDAVGAAEDLRATVEDASISAELRGLGRVVLAWLELVAPERRRSRRARTRRAVSQAQQAVELLPEAPLPLLTLGALQLERGRLDKAEASFAAARDLPGGAYGGHVGLARLAVVRKDLKQARALLDVAVTLSPNRTTAYGDRYRIRHAANDPEAASDRARAITRAPRKLRTAALTPQADLFALAERAAEHGAAAFADAAQQGAALPRALSWMQRALLFDPSSLSATARTASLLHLTGRDAEAGQAYARALAVDPLLLEAGLMRGVVQRDLIEGAGAAAAEDTLREVLAQVPTTNARLQGAVRYELARALIAQDQLEQALPILAEAQKHTPRYCIAGLRARLLTRLKKPQAKEAIDEASRLFYEGSRDMVRSALYLQAALRLRLRGRPQRAEHMLTRAIEADPRNAQAWFTRAKVRFQGTPQQFPWGIVDEYVAAELEPRYTVRFIELAARLTRFRGVLVMVLQQADVILQEAPELPAAAFMKGYLHFFLNQHDKAERWFNRAFELSRGRSYFSLGYRGAARMKLKKYKEARQDLDRANALFPNAPMVAWWRAALHAKQGEDAQAFNILEQLAKHGYVFKEHVETTPEFKAILTHPRMKRLLKVRRTTRERRSGRP